MDDTLTTILIVDDNPHARAALTACLSRQPGLRIAAQASNGLEAIRLIERHAPDLILLDAQMPVMDGLEAARHIKTRWPYVKVVMLTMYPSCQPEAQTAGVDGFLVKGCSLFELVAMIHALAKRVVTDSVAHGF